MDDIYYYCYYDRHDHKCYVCKTFVNEYSMTGDYLLFDSAEECAEYYRKQEWEVTI